MELQAKLQMIMNFSAGFLIFNVFVKGGSAGRSDSRQELIFDVILFIGGSTYLLLSLMLFGLKRRMSGTPLERLFTEFIPQTLALSAGYFLFSCMVFSSAEKPFIILGADPTTLRTSPIMRFPCVPVFRYTINPMEGEFHFRIPILRCEDSKENKPVFIIVTGNVSMKYKRKTDIREFAPHQLEFELCAIKGMMHAQEHLPSQENLSEYSGEEFLRLFRLHSSNYVLPDYDITNIEIRDLTSESFDELSQGRLVKGILKVPSKT